MTTQPEKQPLTQNDRQWIAWLIAVALIVVGTFLGVQFPQLPPTPDDYVPLAVAGGVTNLSGLVVAAPTSIATTQPALLADSTGLSNIIEVRDAATPVFTVNDGGAVVGNVLQYGSAGEKAVATTQDVTGTATVAHGLTTVTWALCTMGEDPTVGAGDAANISVAISANVVTCKLWQDDGVTAATEADVTTHCLVIGTP
jgi:hypothetical protein